MIVMNDREAIDLFPETLNPKPMRYILHENHATINGTTIRLLRCRNHTQPKDNPNDLKVGRTKNELVASFYDSKRQKWRDFIRMIVADTQPEAMPQFLGLAVKEIAHLLPRYAQVDKVQRADCQTVSSFEQFAEAMQRR